MQHVKAQGDTLPSRMNEVAFVEKREPEWQRLSFLCDKATNSLRALSPAEFHEFVRVYRRASTDLALVRTRSSNIQLIAFLNDLVGRSYSVIYSAPRKPLWAAALGFVVLSAQTMRRCKFFVLTSAIVFVGSVLFSFVLMRYVPDTRQEFVPAQFEETFKHWKSGEFTEASASQASMMTAVYSSNNPRVAVMTGAMSAATFGVGSAYSLYQNGIMLGALSREMDDVGKLGLLYASIMPHGVTELSGAVVSGASGFVMAWALINPGRRKRGVALKEAGKDAIVLLCTSMILMFMAAPIEGFFSFNPRVPIPVKIGVIVVSAIFWIVFWTGFGKSPEEQTSALSSSN